MIDERKEETASLYAFGLLEGQERIAFEAELDRDPELLRLVAELQQASSSLALSSRQVAPTPKLRDRVMASIETAALSTKLDSNLSAPQSALAEKAQVVAFPLAGWLGWAAAACFAVVAGYTSVRYMATRAEVVVQRESTRLVEIQLQSVEQTLEAERILATKQIADLQRAGDLAQLKIARLASLNKNSPEAVAIAVWNPLKQEGVLTVENLPFIQQDQDYQLWVVDPAYANPVNGGVFKVDARGTAHISFRPDQPVTAATKFAISRERRGGVPKAEGPMVALGEL